jgi:hypothetical protein
MPALPLFAQLRRFTLAVLAAAESTAEFEGFLYPDSPANGKYHYWWVAEAAFERAVTENHLRKRRRSK